MEMANLYVLAKNEDAALSVLEDLDTANLFPNHKLATDLLDILIDDSHCHLGKYI
jgi:hypothetical protein